MEITAVELDGGVTRLILNGRLDIAGSDAIGLKFNVYSGMARALIVDLAAVSFMASLGIRLLVIGAKTVASKGGKMVLLAPSADIENVLTTAGIDRLIPIHHDLKNAVAGVSP